jgi:hypothetical protein
MDPERAALKRVVARPPRSAVRLLASTGMIR